DAGTDGTGNVMLADSVSITTTGTGSSVFIGAAGAGTGSVTALDNVDLETDSKLSIAAGQTDGDVSFGNRAELVALGSTIDIDAGTSATSDARFGTDATLRTGSNDSSIAVTAGGQLAFADTALVQNQGNNGRIDLDSGGETSFGASARMENQGNGGQIDVNAGATIGFGATAFVVNEGNDGRIVLAAGADLDFGATALLQNEGDNGSINIAAGGEVAFGATALMGNEGQMGTIDIGAGTSGTFAGTGFVLAADGKLVNDGDDGLIEIVSRTNIQLGDGAQLLSEGGAAIGRGKIALTAGSGSASGHVSIGTGATFKAQQDIALAAGSATGHIALGTGGFVQANSSTITFTAGADETSRIDIGKHSLIQTMGADGKIRFDAGGQVKIDSAVGTETRLINASTGGTIDIDAATDADFAGDGFVLGASGVLENTGANGRIAIESRKNVNLADGVRLKSQGGTGSVAVTAGFAFGTGSIAVGHSADLLAETLLAIAAGTAEGSVTFGDAAQLIAAGSTIKIAAGASAASDVLVGQAGRIQALGADSTVAVTAGHDIQLGGQVLVESGVLRDVAGDPDPGQLAGSTSSLTISAGRSNTGNIQFAAGVKLLTDDTLNISVGATPGAGASQGNVVLMDGAAAADRVELHAFEPDGAKIEIDAGNTEGDVSIGAFALVMADGSEIDIHSGRSATSDISLGNDSTLLAGGNDSLITINAGGGVSLGDRVQIKALDGVRRFDATGDEIPQIDIDAGTTNVTFGSGVLLQTGPDGNVLGTAVAIDNGAADPGPFVGAFTTTPLDIFGRSTLTTPLGATGEEKLIVQINWGDGTTLDTPAPPADPLKATRYVRDAGTNNFEHLFDPRGGNRPNPAAPFDIRLSAEFDPSIAIDGGGEDFTTTNDDGILGDDDLGTELEVLATSFGAGITQVTAQVPVLFVRELTVIDANAGATNNTPVSAQVLDIVAAIAADVQADERLVIVIALRPDGSVLDTVTFTGTEADDLLNNLPNYLARLPDGKYQIFLREPGEQRTRLFRSLLIREGKPIEERQDEQPGEQGAPDQPTAGRNAAPPAGPPGIAEVDVDRLWERWVAPQAARRLLERQNRPLLPVERVEGPVEADDPPKVIDVSATDLPPLTEGGPGGVSGFAAPAIAALLLGTGQALSEQPLRTETARQRDAALERLPQRVLNRAARLLRRKPR
ncbi:MAG: hypothetical protein KY476_21740, partial [Planctomycetes bacterium]|nr:hypothetical protein [Planctomycetota bacterium]